MKWKYLIMIISLWLSATVARAQINLTGIDSLYLTSLDDFYKTAVKAKDDIWKGMQPAPVCMYRHNGPAFLYNHPAPPEGFVKLSDQLYMGKQSDLNLFGATQMKINGTLTAINNYDESRYGDAAEAYAELFHELHHVYQRNFIRHISHDNPAVLLTYPENAKNDAIKLYEQQLLYRLCFEKDSLTFRHWLNQFYSARLQREQLIGDYLQYEKTVENMEGPAFYCEYRFYNRNTTESRDIKNNYNQRHFFGVLTMPYYGRDHLRNRHLAAGMALCYILDRKCKDWKTEYYAQNKSLFDFFAAKLKPKQEALIVDSMYFRLSRFHTEQEIQKHKETYQQFIAQDGVKISLIFRQNPRFKGFDPMHAEGINDSTVLHKTMLALSNGKENQLFITHHNVITITDGDIWKVKKVILFVPPENIQITNNTMVINQQNNTISWSGKLQMKTENEIIFQGE